MKNVMIPESLFFDLIRYFLGNNNEELTDKISEQLLFKLDKLAQHELYSKMQTAPTEDEREKARNEYLDARGIPQSFRF